MNNKELKQKTVTKLLALCCATAKQSLTVMVWLSVICLLSIKPVFSSEVMPNFGGNYLSTIFPDHFLFVFQNFTFLAQLAVSAESYMYCRGAIVRRPSVIHLSSVCPSSVNSRFLTFFKTAAWIQAKFYLSTISPD